MMRLSSPTLTKFMNYNFLVSMCLLDLFGRVKQKNSRFFFLFFLLSMAEKYIVGLSAHEKVENFLIFFFICIARSISEKLKIN